MASQAQLEANRRNAEKSSGPRTPAGKEKAARNAVKHGLFTQAALLHGEDEEAYAYHHREMFEELCPDGMQEAHLARRIVDLSWRLQRAERYHDAVFAALYEKYVIEQAALASQPGAGGGAGVPPAAPEEEVPPVERNPGLAGNPHSGGTPALGGHPLRSTAGGGCPTGPQAPAPDTPPDPAVLGRLLLEDFSGAGILERVLRYELRIERSLYRALTELRELRWYPRQGKRPSWEAYGAGNGGPEVAWDAPAPVPAAAPANQSCKTNPISEEVSSLKCGVSSDESRMAGLPSSNFTLETSNSAAGRSYKTNPMDVLTSLRKGDARVRLVCGKRA
jgi:hypothetical protein